MDEHRQLIQMDSKSEIERIKEAYKKRKENVPPQLYSFFNDGSLFFVQKREWDILKVLKAYKITSLIDKKILDVGCGAGGELRNLMRYSAQPENLYGIDLLSDRIQEARRMLPNINFQCGNAEDLPYERDFFDIIIQFTVFTSILDNKMKQTIAKEMLRVLKPGGIILWYDYHRDNPGNPDVKGVKKKEIYDLYPGCEIYLKRVTLAPPLARAIAPHSWLLCYLLENLRIFNTHYIGVIRKNELSGS